MFLILLNGLMTNTFLNRGMDLTTLKILLIPFKNLFYVIVLDCGSKNWLNNDYLFPSHLKLLGLTLNVSQNSLSLLTSLNGSYKIVLTKKSRKIERSTIRTTRVLRVRPNSKKCFTLNILYCRCAINISHMSRVERDRLNNIVL